MAYLEVRPDNVTMTTRYPVIGAVLSAAWGVASIASMFLGTNYNWPDFVHTNYGFPLAYATHTANTIAGPVDKWSLDLNSLAVDTLFWMAGIAVILLMFALLTIRSSRRSRSPSEA